MHSITKSTAVERTFEERQRDEEVPDMRVDLRCKKLENSGDTKMRH